MCISVTDSLNFQSVDKRYLRLQDKSHLDIVFATVLLPFNKAQVQLRRVLLFSKSTLYH